MPRSIPPPHPAMKLLGSDGLSHNSLCLPRQSLEMSAQCVSEAKKCVQRIFFRCVACKIARARFSLTEERRSEKEEKRNEANEGIVRTTLLGFSESGRILQMAFEFASPKIAIVPCQSRVCLRYPPPPPRPTRWRQSRLRISEAVDRKSQSRESSIRKM